METRIMSCVWNIWGVLLLLSLQCQYIDSDSHIQTITRSIQRRDTLQDQEDIFKELDFELNVDNTQRTQTPGAEKAESEKIFQELLDETTDSKSPRRTTKNSESVQRITDSISRLIFPGKKSPSGNSNILGVLSSFLNPNRFSGKR